MSLIRHVQLSNYLKHPNKLEQAFLQITSLQKLIGLLFQSIIEFMKYWMEFLKFVVKMAGLEESQILFTPQLLMEPGLASTSWQLVSNSSHHEQYQD
jgi:hypothetical protein